MGSRARGPVAALTETGCSDAPLLPLNTDAPKKASKSVGCTATCKFCVRFFIFLVSLHDIGSSERS
jgi:hypothetical protein